MIGRRNEEMKNFIVSGPVVYKKGKTPKKPETNTNVGMTNAAPPTVGEDFFRLSTTAQLSIY
jgi:hypothetical protein